MNYFDEETGVVVSNRTETGSLLVKLQEYLKKPSLEADLDKLLDVFTKKIHCNGKQLAEGIVQTNFTESALFVQCAGLLYAKKVDLLWNTTMESLERMSQFERECEKKKKIAENEKKETAVATATKEIVEKTPDRMTLLEKRRAARRKREELNKIKKITYNQEKLNKLVENVLSNSTDIFTNVSVEKFVFNDVNHSLFTDDPCELYLNKPVILVDEEILDEDDEFTTTMENLTSFNFISNLKENELHYKVNSLKETLLHTDYFYEEDDYLQDFILNKDICVSKLESEFSDEFEKYVSRRQDEKKTAGLNLSTELLQMKKDLCPKNSVIRLQRLSQDEMLRYAKDPVLCDKIKRANSTCVPTQQSVEGQTNGCPNSIGSRRNSDDNNNDPLSDSGFQTMTADSSFAESQNSNDESQELEHTFDCIENAQEDSNSPEKIQETDSNTAEERENSTKNAEETQEVEKTEQKKRKIQKVYEDEDDIPLIKLIKKPRKTSFAVLIRGKMSVNIHEFEKFYQMNYQKELNEEGLQCEFLCDSDEDDGVANSDAVSNLDEEPERIGDTSSSVLNETENQDSENNPDSSSLSKEQTALQESEISSTDLQLPSDSTEPQTSSSDIQSSSAEPQPSTSEPQPSTSESQPSTSEETALSEDNQIISSPELLKLRMEMAESRQRVREWQCLMREKLRHKESSDFDIHAYSATIMDALPTNSNRKFAEIVAGKSASEVSKYFLATLNLANMNNVEICKVPSGAIANDVFELKPLNRKLHRANFDDLHTPTEDSFQQNLPHVNSSTPLPAKKTLKHSAKRTKLQY